MTIDKSERSTADAFCGACEPRADRHWNGFHQRTVSVCHPRARYRAIHNKKLALVFPHDLQRPARSRRQTSRSRVIHFFVFFTGRFYRNPSFESTIRRLKRDGHYLGAHSDEHLLYCDWSDREKLLISREKFEQDLNRNYVSMRLFGIKKTDARYFLPPFEWYNQRISDWTAAMNLQLINFSSGTRSHADYTTPE